MFYLYVPYHGEKSRLPEAYAELAAARAAADEKAVYGYCVCDEAGEGVYSPVGSFIASHILHHAKCAADHMRIHGYKYGDADQNPALDKESEHPEKLVSCDRFCGWVLYEAGYTAHQPKTKGLPLYYSPNLEEFLIKHGFTRIDDVADLRPGDVIFEGDSTHFGPTFPDQFRSFPRHVYIHAGPAEDGLFYRYDSGSDQRIQSVQPMIERLVKPEQNRYFRFAYRAPEISWEDAKAAHALCTCHRDALTYADKCGCFYCKSIYDPKEIKEWVDGGKTALCPYCGIDSVIPETEEYPLTTAFLRKMHHKWFT